MCVCVCVCVCVYVRAYVCLSYISLHTYMPSQLNMLLKNSQSPLKCILYVLYLL